MRRLIAAYVSLTFLYGSYSLAAKPWWWPIDLGCLLRPWAC